MTHHNCFECEGMYRECSHYKPANKETQLCVYRQVADSDLEKFARDKGRNITLISQFMEYYAKIMEKYKFPEDRR